MDLPVIHTNIWDAIYAIPSVMIVIQILKLWLDIPKPVVPYLALLIGLLISVFISHKHDMHAGIFMGIFYGLSAIGNFSSLRATYIWYKKNKKQRGF